ncbi:MAG: tRNA pseudouridine(38-40) synthase TruA [Anaerolineales bacterium]|nr:tRNA pseudouridine(38-40) synthase TruA [Anaerolineales bacterium]
MAHYKSILAYDGTAYKGFQRQQDGIATVQAEVEDALRRIGWREKSLLAAGRTDTGVHARGQVISFSLDWGHSSSDLTAALNAYLPADIAVQATEIAPEDFHPRFSAQRRRYRYGLLIAEVRDPLRERYLWRRWPGPDLATMNTVAQGLEGRHDFRAFGPPPIEGGHTVREVFYARWSREHDRLSFLIEANAYLQHMVRRLVAALVRVGEERELAEAVIGRLDRPDERWEGPLAPPRGLVLEAVMYAKEDHEK